MAKSTKVGSVMTDLAGRLLAVVEDVEDEASAKGSSKAKKAPKASFASKFSGFKSMLPSRSKAKEEDETPAETASA
jgi:hypothetical protein